MAEAIYTTRRTMLIEERNRLSQAIADAFGALTALMNGKITSYGLGTWTISRAQADIDKLKQSEVRNLSWREFDWLMSGIDIDQPKALKAE